MNIRQVKIEFNAEQDRLLARFATSDGAELRLWLTRRCVRLLWPILIKMAETAPAIATQAAPEARKALLGMEHEKALAQADFATPYKEGAATYPLGAEPILEARMNNSRSPEGQNVLTLLPREGQGLNLGLDYRLLHGITRLLQDAVAKAQWDLPLVLPTGLGSVGDEGAPKLLN